MMGVTETIADTIDDYVAIAAKLARDPQARNAARQRIADNKSKLYRDRAVIGALEAYIERAARAG
jgi:predicted O-linked N-acetylglucosamine transferase (SPINDLY family)